MSKATAPQRLGNHTTCSGNKFQAVKFSREQKIRALNFRGATPTAKLSENKTRAKISGSTVLYNGACNRPLPSPLAGK